MEYKYLLELANRNLLHLIDEIPEVDLIDEIETMWSIEIIDYEMREYLERNGAS